MREYKTPKNLNNTPGNLPFPELPPLDEEQISNILKSLSTGKALSFDLFSDTVLRDEKMMKKLSKILGNLWSDNLKKVEALDKLFAGRLIAFNKVHPKLPKKKEFRPIIILSLIVKIMESRWLPKLKEYMVRKLCPAQTGFVPGQGVFTNIFRAIKRVEERLNRLDPSSIGCVQDGFIPLIS